MNLPVIISLNSNEAKRLLVGTVLPVSVVFETAHALYDELSRVI